jgi:hypothetical protein
MIKFTKKSASARINEVIASHKIIMRENEQRLMELQGYKIENSIITSILYYTVISGMVYALGCAVSLAL